MKNLKRFIQYYKPHKKLLFLDLLASFLVAAIGMGYPIITRKMLNDFIPNHQYDLIIIFGCSLGKSDNWWWRKIYTAIESDEAELIIYNYGKDEEADIIEKFICSWLIN